MLFSPAEGTVTPGRGRSLHCRDPSTGGAITPGRGKPVLPSSAGDTVTPGTGRTPHCSALPCAAGGIVTPGRGHSLYFPSWGCYDMGGFLQGWSSTHIFPPQGGLAALTENVGHRVEPSEQEALFSWPAAHVNPGTRKRSSMGQGHILPSTPRSPQPCPCGVSSL